METQSWYLNTTRVVAYAFAAVILLSLPARESTAQPNLNFKRITVNWPTIELYFSVGCNGNPAYNMTKQDFKIFENGVEVKDFTLWCPDPTIRCAISVALVFDASGSMSGSGNAGAKQAGKTFIDLMDGVLDEAAVIWFNTMVNIQQQMTTLKPLLYSAVDALPASGGTAVWDGCYAGIIELINNGVNQCRAVIVMTDGGDNASTRTPAEIISLANRNRIRVFTIGLGSSINATELEMIALLTGGRYYQTPNAGQLAAIYQEISTIIFQGFQECVITYQRDCADGGMRTVELQLVNFCGGTDVKTKTYRAPLDSSTFSDLHMEMTDAEGLANTDVKVHLLLKTPILKENLYPLTFDLHYDSCLQFKNVATPPGALLENVPIRVSPVAGAVQIRMDGKKVLNGSGLLMELTFTTSNTGKDTLCCDVWAENVTLEQGCHAAMIEAAEVCVFPHEAEVSCSIEGPDSLAWDVPMGAYIPNPFTITARYNNTGIGSVRNPQYTLQYDPSQVQLVSPAADTQTGLDIPSGNHADISWQLHALPTTVAGTIHLCITGDFDHHNPVRCCMSIPIDAMETQFECILHATKVNVNLDSSGYAPLPILVWASLENTGSVESGRLTAEIHTPEAFSLTGTVVEKQPLREFVPSTLQPAEQSFIKWYLMHPAVFDTKTEQISIAFYEEGSPVCGGAVAITLPALPMIFHFSIDSSDALTFCEGQSVTLRASTDYATYLWSTGERTRSITATTPGMYYCVAKNVHGQTGYSDTVYVHVYPRPQSMIALNGSNPLCDGDTLVLDAGAGFVSYHWSTGARTRTIEVLQEGDYHAEITDHNGCIGYTDTVQVTVLPAPAKPVITRTDDNLHAPSATVYRWFRNGQRVPAAIAQDLHIIQPGRYQVEIVNSYGCSALSDPFIVTVLDVADKPLPSLVRIAVYPDPARDVATLNVDLANGEPAGIWLIDILGRRRHLTDIAAGTASIELPLNLTAVPVGIYHVVVETSRRTVTRKFLRQ